MYFRIFGTYFSDDLFDLQYPLMLKSLEGIVEAGPQLVLQLYIIARNGMDIGIDMNMGGKFYLSKQNCSNSSLLFYHRLGKIAVDDHKRLHNQLGKCRSF